VDGERVLVEDPFTWPGQDAPGQHGQHGHDAPHGDTADITRMEEVMEIMRDALLVPSAAAGAVAAATVGRPARLAFRELLLGVTLPDEFG
jgi:hypothetical protein